MVNHRASAIDQALANEVRARRIAHGLSMQQLAHAIGVTYQQVSKYERGVDRVSVAQLVNLARVFEVEPGALLTEVCQEVEK